MKSTTPPLPVCSPSAKRNSSIGHSPAMVDNPVGDAPSISAIESLLSEWFDAPTLLFSSGRAACQMFLAQKGLHPYRSTIRVPEFLSRCILNALTLNAFPVRNTNADAILFYHQYGFRQLGQPREAIVIEDACHAFFNGPISGARKWSGQAAIFSLPKFFATQGLVGALTTPDKELYERIKERRDAAADIDPELAAWRREVIIDSTNNGHQSPLFKLIESAYALLTEFPKADQANLSGFPSTRQGLAEIGTARRERLDLFAEHLGDLFPHFMFENGLDDLPYALPIFADDREALQKLDKVVSEFGVHCGVYSLDAARSMYAPEYRPCLLLPCNQELPLNVVRDICQAIRSAAKQ